MEIIVASGNAHKIEEIRNILSHDDIKVISIYDKVELYEAPEENGETFKDNAFIKADHIHKIFNDAYVLSDDSGLMVDYLDGAPGVHSARYAGDSHDDSKNNKLLMKNLEGVPLEERTAQFVSVLCLIEPSGEINYFKGTVKGKIMFSASGNNGFGYDPYFKPDGYEKTFAEMTGEEKNKISHRKRALSKLEEFLKSK